MPTKTNKKSKTTKQRFSKQQIAIILLSIVVSLLTVAIIVIGFFTKYTWYVLQTESNFKITMLIQNAVEGLSQPAPIDPQTGNVFLPQVKLTLPMTKDTLNPKIEYRYSPAQGDFPGELRIVNTPEYWSARYAMISAQKLEDTFEEVPRLQACSRGYLLSFSPVSNSADPLTFTKQLSDGRSLYAYLDSGCNESNDDFLNYLKQIDSY